MLNWHRKIEGLTFFSGVSRAAGGYGSESEAEDQVDSQVTLPQDLPGRGNIKSEKSSVKLTEVKCSRDKAVGKLNLKIIEK